VMFGGPIIFLLIFWIGVRAIIGPVPEKSPVERLRNGDIAVGASLATVQKELGRPTRLQELPDGGFRFVYTRTVYESATKSDRLDEAEVEFDAMGKVQSIRFDPWTPPKE
jgi:hypothetical protein